MDLGLSEIDIATKSFMEFIIGVDNYKHWIKLKTHLQHGTNVEFATWLLRTAEYCYKKHGSRHQSQTPSGSASNTGNVTVNGAPAAAAAATANHYHAQLLPQSAATSAHQQSQQQHQQQQQQQQQQNATAATVVTSTPTSSSSSAAFRSANHRDWLSMPVSFDKQQQQQQQAVHYTSSPSYAAATAASASAHISHNSSNPAYSQQQQQQQLHNQQQTNHSAAAAVSNQSAAGDVGGVSVCTVCGSMFAQVNQLRKHMRSEHPKDKPYPCSECGMRFTRRDHMARHLRKHQGVYPYNCSYCHKSFTRKDSWMKHERWHGANPYTGNGGGGPAVTPKTEKEIESLAVTGLALLSGTTAAMAVSNGDGNERNAALSQKVAGNQR